MRAKKAEGKPIGVVDQEYILLEVNAVKPHPRNVNQGDVGAVVESIHANQFYGAVVVQKSTGLIIAGKHRWLAAKECGLEKIPAIVVDVDDVAAKRIMLVDNRTTRLGHDDDAALMELLKELTEQTGTLEGTGFDGDDLDELLKELSTPDFQPVSKDEQGCLDQKALITCPKCGHGFTV
jgi:ParB-like chromosome segregation protein Spo0J